MWWCVTHQILSDFSKRSFKSSLPVVAWEAVWLSLGLMLLHWMSFWSPVFILCGSVPLSVFLWTCHLQPSRPTLPPSHSSPNSDLMPASCWSLTHIFIFCYFYSYFLATSRAFSLFLCSWKPPPFKVSAMWQIPLTQTVSSAPTGMG